MVVPVIVSIILIGTMAIIPALAAQGTIIWINNPNKHGKIMEDGTGDVYNFQIPKGVTPGYDPTVGDKVTFDPGNGKKATDVTLIPPGKTVNITVRDSAGNLVSGAECNVGTQFSGTHIGNGITENGFLSISVPLEINTEPPNDGVTTTCSSEGVGGLICNEPFVDDVATVDLTLGTDNCGGGGR